jgi:hypothetical protein
LVRVERDAAAARRGDDFAFAEAALVDLGFIDLGITRFSSKFRRRFLDSERRASLSSA